MASSILLLRFPPHYPPISTLANCHKRTTYTIRKRFEAEPWRSFPCPVLQSTTRGNNNVQIINSIGGGLLSYSLDDTARGVYEGVDCGLGGQLAERAPKQYAFV